MQITHLTNLDTFLYFKMTIRCADLNLPVKSDYRDILHDKTKELHEGGLGYRCIAFWLNNNGYKTPRGYGFKNNYIHSILKKKRIRNRRINKPYELTLGD